MRERRIIMEKFLIMIPAYNEEESIIQFLKDIQPYIDKGYDVLVVNDGSTDRTAEKVKAYGNGVRIISQIYNMGYGSALQLGYKYAVENEYDYVVQLDADGQHDALNIKKMEEIMRKPDAPDILIGSRFLTGSTSFRISGIKKAAIRVFRMLIRLTSGQKVTDPTSGLQCLNRKAFEFYAGYTNFDYQYPDANMIIQMCIKGHKISEFPAVMHPREFGTSMHSGVWKPIIYVFIMTLSIINIYFRERENGRR